MRACLCLCGGVRHFWGVGDRGGCLAWYPAAELVSLVGQVFGWNGRSAAAGGRECEGTVEVESQLVCVSVHFSTSSMDSGFSGLCRHGCGD